MFWVCIEEVEGFCFYVVNYIVWEFCGNIFGVWVVLEIWDYGLWKVFDKGMSIYGGFRVV